jgi:hypothetical protein
MITKILTIREGKKWLTTISHPREANGKPSSQAHPELPEYFRLNGKPNNRQKLGHDSQGVAKLSFTGEMVEFVIKIPCHRLETRFRRVT